MAWNQPGAGNDNDKDPWTGKPKQPSSPPDLEQALRELRKKIIALLRKKTSNKSSSNIPLPDNLGIGAGIIASIILAIWFLSGIFVVGPAEQSVILRLGKYIETVGPGPHWIPRFIDTAYTVDEQKISTYSYDSEMLTKDENIVSVAVAVQYRINKTRDYLFSVTNPTESLQQATASALRQVIGNTNLEQVLTTGREKIRQQVQDQIAQILVRYHTGLLVTDVAMQPAKAPDEVKEAFDDAIKAQEDEQRFENQAQAYGMQVEPIAKGNAQRLLAEAKAYQQQVVLNAKANIASFLAILPEYEKSLVVTRERLYLETMENILNNTNKIMIDNHGSNNMFYLPLDKLISSAIKPATVPASNTSSTAPLNAATNLTQDNTISPATRNDRSILTIPGGYE